MPLATNALLQATSTATSRSGTANNAVKSADSSKDGASSFSNVYAKQAKDAVPSRDDAPVKPARDKAAPDKDKVAAGKDKPASDQANAADTSSVADSGNDLPTRSTAAEDDAASAGSKQDDAQASADSALTEGLAIVDPVLDPVLQAMAAQAPALPVARPQSPDVTAAPVATVLTVTQAAPPAATEEAFNPDADPLDGLDAVQLALENANAKTQLAAQNTHAANKATPTNAEADPNQNLVNNLSALSEQLPSEESSTESSDKSFSGLIGEELKDVKSAAGDTRVDNFADRLAALSQAAQPARVAAAPAAAPLMNQPLAMHQSGWTEGIVDRVMYLSSQNLKTADIKLEPAELGRLDIRINMAPEQQTQVTFMSAHMGVRDALESQMSRLRESFVQQGLGNVDVNVSDQSQQQAQQQAQEQASRAQRNGRGNGVSSGDTSDEIAGVDAAVPVSQPAARVIGSSEIDYYA
ncbi:flagellar hook-length control protein [Pseudomonas amygdali pv. eriobotryae]|uniref:Flagellar hook-length control protein n=1 Tax=Pseudomonas amygdali pv. eriobotryae TaxID=129137 RepID=A0A125N2S9_PSEA0|nr:flagellar hook-length control protein FliK [Pseudomonas amygdali]KWS76538.1 flagellar hook-length control protein [Pseudomonas amygdali pv. eriobotryae]RML98902.1 Flagellar hook-length control protein fliK [Pseudomonas amygdali pv. eriobotryae]RMO48482.1 Flagellar hook-length control protein fliK [Pseudomonas amygdali pv. eriobotryae]GFZ57903.1 flagellar hook-length control protein [Pseudomonas amygdali pv. eriobotryae]GFZ69874.1 flagellar hook-length control protein [Pseudomonas amygdali p